jgi:hypothetical protein
MNPGDSTRFKARCRKPVLEKCSDQLRYVGEEGAWLGDVAGRLC